MDEKFLDYIPVYNEKQLKVIQGEFQRIGDNHFLDHTGGTLYSEKQIENVFNDLKNGIFCNPHGKNGPSQQTEDSIDIIRYRILQHFHTNSEEYSVIFTSNATAALKLIAENFDYSNQSEAQGNFIYLEDNHTSVLGMRSYTQNSKALKIDDSFKLFSSSPTLQQSEKDTNSLFVYPAQSNFSGTKYPMEWIEATQLGKLNDFIEERSKNWFVALDAASFVSTDDLDLSKYKPDFVTISFYKIFGYPTGLGALLVKNSSQQVLVKQYYGGGTVLMALALQNVSVLRNSISERFEDGSIPYLSILALNHGFETFSRMSLSMKHISDHTFNLAKYVFRNLLCLHHSNGEAAAVLYHDTVFENNVHQGAIVNFNLKRDNGKYIGYSEVMHMANLHEIYLRTGCSCNPGACQKHLQLSCEEVKKHFQAGHVCGDEMDLVDGIPTGSIRVSFGYMSTKEDANALLRMIEDCFVQKPVLRKLPSNWDTLKTNYKNRFFSKKKDEIVNIKITHENIHNKILIDRFRHLVNNNDGHVVSGILKYIFLYPIKSCGAFSPVGSWNVCSSGLEYDRKWMIVNKMGSCITQKNFPKMCLIKPFIDLENNVLDLSFPDVDSISLPLKDSSRTKFRRCESKICRDKVIGFDCGDVVAKWLDQCLKCDGLRLIEQIDDNVARVNKKGENLELSFANQSQYLMLNLKSIEWLADEVKNDNITFSESIRSMSLRFRPNIVIGFHEAFVENELQLVEIGPLKFETVGSCTRCQMICINQLNAQKTKEPLITLAKLFDGKVQFGVYLKNGSLESGENSLSIGQLVVAHRKI